MAEFNIPRNDGDLVVFLADFAAAMATYAEDLGYDTGDIQKCTDASGEWRNAVTNVNEAKRNLKARITDKGSQRVVSVKTARDYAQQIKNNPAATNEIKNAFGINTSPSGSGSVTVPTQVSAQANSNGTARVKWNRNGNIRGTVFLIEVSSDSAWVLYATTTKTSFVDNSATPGVQKMYRIRAQRGNVTSAPSGTATIYPVSGDGELRLAA